WSLLVAVSLALAFGITGTGLFDRLSSGQPEIPGAESHQGMERLAKEDETTQVTLVLRDIDVTDTDTIQAVAVELAPIRGELAALPGVSTVLDPFLLPDGLDNPDVAALVAQDRDGFLVIVEMAEATSTAEAS